MMSAAPSRARPTPNDAVSDRERVAVSAFRTGADEESVNLTPVVLSESMAAHVAPDAPVATGACALARLPKGIKQTNAYADTAYVFNAARIVVLNESQRCHSTIMPCMKNSSRRAFCKSRSAIRYEVSRLCRIRGENPSSLLL